MHRSAVVARRSKIIAGCALASVPPLVALWFISTYGVNTFIADDIEFAQRFEKFAQGNLSYPLFMQPHNEHRAPISILAMILIGSFTSHSSVALMYASWCLLLCSLGIVFYTLKKAQFSNANALLLVAAASATFYSLRDSETFLFGILFCSTVTFFFSIVSFYYLASLKDQSDRKNLFLAMAGAFGSTFGGFAGGAFCWPIGLAMIVFRACMQTHDRSLVASLKEWKLPILSWLIATAVAACLFFSASGMNASSISAPTVPTPTIPAPNIPSSSDTGSITSGLTNIVSFFLTLLGFPIYPLNFQLFGLIHLLLITLAAVLFLSNLRHSKRTSIDHEPAVPNNILLMFGFACMTFGLALSLLITGARSQPGDVTYLVATAPRYALWTSLSLFGCFLIAISDRTSKRLLRTCVLIVSIACIGLGYYSGVERSRLQGKFTSIQLKSTKYFLSTYRQQPAETLLMVYPDLQNFIPTAENIEKRRWNVFAHIPAELKTLPACPTQKFQYAVVGASRKNGNTYIVIRNQSPMFVVSGWAIDSIMNLPSSDICLNIGDAYVMKGVCGLPSDELKFFFGREKLLKSGFLITFATKNLQPGTYPVSLTIANSARTQAMKTEELFLLKVE